MAATDRNVLRLGAFEILYTDTPDRVAINEAVELAKRFGSRAIGPVRQRHSRPVAGRPRKAVDPRICVRNADLQAFAVIRYCN